MPQFVPGQRWISETEPELGLGIVLAAEHHRVTILYIASSERRIYAIENAPLTRVRFGRGETVENIDGLKVTVKDIRENTGIITYSGIDENGQVAVIEEMELNHFLQFHKPQDRLFSGQLDSTQLYKLRYRTLKLIGELEQSTIKGLTGSRTSLIPHQLFIAHEVARREAPRVLLADEVGLGKTIEAGLIIHYQLLSGRAERILIVVPEPLLYQWLLEMRRRFNLRFSLFDEQRYLEAEQENPFQSAQQVLCSLEFFMADPKRQAAAVEAGWDLCVVDEAHHLVWSEPQASPEYQFIERLGKSAPGLLLLTATPEQLGKKSHFARLRLLDPDRFHDFDLFIKEESEYESVADVINHLLDDPVLNPEWLARLSNILKDDLADDLIKALDNPKESQKARDTLKGLMLDRHGTGRILFRNTRASVKGFPKREILPTALNLPEAYQNLTLPAVGMINRTLNPESLYQAHVDNNLPWWRIDTRVAWLIDCLKSITPSKALIISSSAATAIHLEEALRQAGIRAAAFHEGLGVIARDRAAAWFAETENGAQALVCSEIGSEGRNFQFAQHLILFDLPLNPDLLEQRIGRLDRIGQLNTIFIHIGYFKATAQEFLFKWYHEALDALQHPNPAAVTVHRQLAEKLETALQASDASHHNLLIEEGRKLSEAVQLELHNGRDRLLELNSCRKEEAETLMHLAKAMDTDERLWPFMEETFDAFGVNLEEHSENCHILRPGEHLRVQFPELPDDGITITLDRKIALAREDMLFLTFEHPMVMGAIDMIINSEHGNAALNLVSHPDLEPGQILLENIYLAECVAPQGLHISRFFPPTLLRFLVDQTGTDISAIAFEDLQEQPRQYDREHAQELIRGQRRTIEKLLKKTEQQAQKKLAQIIANSTENLIAEMTSEIKRLAALRRVNPNVRQEELDLMKDNTLRMHGCIQSARLRLDAVRLLVAI